MSIFGSIMHKIFHHDSAEQPASADATSAAPAAGAPTAPRGTATAPSAAAQSAPAQAVDVGAVLTQMASQKGGGGNYQTSIVDLLKLLDLDSSMTARTELANEMNVHTGAAGTAEENIALHKAVMAKLAENGGTVPASFQT